MMQVAILDGTNVSKERRNFIANRVAREVGRGGTYMMLSLYRYPDMHLRSCVTVAEASDCRAWLVCGAQDGFEILWIESICQDPRVIEHNVQQLREASPDYVADKDFERRIEFYKRDYSTLEVGRGVDMSCERGGRGSSSRCA